LVEGNARSGLIKSISITMSFQKFHRNEMSFIVSQARDDFSLKVGWNVIPTP
jgi:hypothetical protein